MLLCGWLPPLLANAAGFIGTAVPKGEALYSVVAALLVPATAQTLPLGLSWGEGLGRVERQLGEWLCEGIWLLVTVTVEVPPVWPRV